MTLKIQAATKRQARGRFALVGPSGSGKTWTALTFAEVLGQRVLLIDSERGSASKYADRFRFDVIQLEGQYAPQRYIEAIALAESRKDWAGSAFEVDVGTIGYDVLIIDSLSHAWAGKDGALEQLDKIKARSKSNSSFDAWRIVTPLHNQLVDAILNADLHVFATMRTKSEWVIEKDEQTGKNKPRKIGLQPVQRDGLEYEFDVVADMDAGPPIQMIVSKSRCPTLNAAVVATPGEETAKIFRAWLTEGAEPLPRVAAVAPAPAAPIATLKVEAENGRVTVKVEAENGRVTQKDAEALVAAVDLAGFKAEPVGGRKGAVFPGWFLQALGLGNADKLMPLYLFCQNRAAYDATMAALAAAAPQKAPAAEMEPAEKGAPA